MTRSFIKHALQNPPSGLEAEVRWLYFTQGKLGKVIADSTALITLSKDAVGPGSNLVSDERAINRLTLGGILTLGRTLSHLQNILDSERDYVTPV
jgi:ubiquitin-conjugating enzyme E2 O